MTWLEGIDIFGITVEKHEIPRSGGRPYYPMRTDQGVVVLHSTEGSSIAGALSTLHDNADASHFLVGEDRIIQLRPLDMQAAALHSPQNAYCFQIECVGFTQLKLWRFDEWDKHTYEVHGKQVPIPIPKGSTLKPLCAILAHVVQAYDVPLARPSTDWKDDMSDCPMPWASNNKRRREGLWPKVRGIWSHVEVPFQAPTWHYDLSPYDYTSLFVDVNAQVNPPADAVPDGSLTDGNGVN